MREKRGRKGEGKLNLVAEVLVPVDDYYTFTETTRHIISTSKIFMKRRTQFGIEKIMFLCSFQHDMWFFGDSVCYLISV